MLGRPCEPTQKLDLAVPTFEPDQFLFLVPELGLHLLAWRTERVAGRSPCIGASLVSRVVDRFGRPP
jgi:hypothetical protein